jgi:hypothetical protein
MNEFYAAEPTCCKDSSELRLLLVRFGPYAGRYLAEYPAKWSSFLTGHFEELRPLETERVKTCLRRAYEQGALLRNPTLQWDEKREWVDNAKMLLSSAPPKLNGLVVSTENASIGDITLDNFETQLPLTADEKASGTVEEYLRVSKTLLAISPELFFVDQYLNPCKSQIRPVMEGMLKKVVGQKCQRVSCFARASSVVGQRSHSWKDVTDAWAALLRQIGWPKDRVFEYVLLDDDGSAEKLHARYLLSIKGGIRFEHGFQIQPRKAKVDVCPINATIHEVALGQFKDGIHDWKRVYEFRSPS